MAKKEFRLSYVYGVGDKQCLITIYTNYVKVAGVQETIDTCEIDYTFDKPVYLKTYTGGGYRLYSNNKFITSQLKKSKQITIYKHDEITLEFKGDLYFTPRSSELVECQLSSVEFPVHEVGDYLFNDPLFKTRVTKVIK